MHYNAIIIGAGITGCTIARLLAEKGQKVLIIEKRRHLGGNCYDYKNEFNITIHKYGPHIFHTNNQTVWEFLNRFSSFNPYQHKVLSYINGDFIPFPINRNTLCKVFGTEIPITEIENLLKNEASRAVFNQPAQNFRDVVVSQVGEKLYEIFFKNYTLKQWNKNPEELSPEVANRIPVRKNRDDRYFTDKYQGIPSQGYTKMIENIVEHQNIAILLNTDYFEIKESLNAELTIYTGELDKFFDYKFGKLEYRSLDIEFKTIDKEYFQPASVVNYPNDYNWTRITEFKYFLDEPNPKTTLCFEYPKAEGEPYYVVLTKENIDKRKLYMDEVEKLEQTGQYLFSGRLAEYKYYNMDQAIENALQKITRFINFIQL